MNSQTPIEKAERLVWELGRVTEAIENTPCRDLDKKEIMAVIGRLENIIGWLP